MRKYIALAIALIMALALAACNSGNTPTPPPTDNRNGESQSNGGSQITVAAGDAIQFGDYDWRVLEVQDGKIFVFRMGEMDAYWHEAQPYHTDRVDITWEHSSMRAFLNDEFYNSFSTSERELMLETMVVNNDRDSGIPGGNDTVDKIFLLSIDEAYLYYTGGYINNIWTWLRSPGSNSNETACFFRDPEFTRSNVDDVLPFAPAMWLTPDPNYINIIDNQGITPSDSQHSQPQGGGTAGNESVTLDKSSYTPGENIRVTLTGITQDLVNAGGWAGVFRAGASHNAWGELNLWQYVSSAGTVNLTFAAPSAAGNYEVRLFNDGGDSDGSFVTSVSFTVN